MDYCTVHETGTLEENELAFLKNHNIPILKSYIFMSPIEIQRKNSLNLLKCSNRKAKMDVIKHAKKIKEVNILQSAISDLAHKAKKGKKKRHL